jgi:primosomal protein N' (replication factor Y) (superfamily II helicase)
VNPFAEVAVNAPPVRGAFHYHVPPVLEGQVAPGHLVIVPFGQRRVQGVVTRLLPEAEVPETRPIESLVDPAPVLRPEQLALAAWMADRTLAPLIDCLSLMLPPGLAQQADQRFTLIDEAAPPRTAAEKRIVALLSERGPLRGRQLEYQLPRVDWRRAVEALVRRGALTRESILSAPAVRPRRIRTVTLTSPASAHAENQLGTSPDSRRRRKAVLDLLAREPGPVHVNWVYAEARATGDDLRFLEQHDLVSLGETEVWRDPLADLDYLPTVAPELTADQAAAWERIRPAMEATDEAPPPILLHGVTASGKTELYLRAIDAALSRGRTAIMLVPEIAMTPLIVGRLMARFPGRVGLLHSRLSDGERYDTWRRCRSGQLPIVLGPRSALFAPLPNLGLIVLDEEHDESYKEQGLSPRYHARDAAMAYARLVRGVCLLGSATPDVETTFQAERGRILRLQLPQRILGHRIRLQQQSSRLGVDSRYRHLASDTEIADMPPVRVVDMRQELKAGNPSLFSRPLQQALQETLDARQQAILFLNRRGEATFVFCRDCGWVARCPRCHIPLTHHPGREALLCHRCGYRRAAPAQCPNCHGARVRYFGAGTQRVQQELATLFPSARALRWDYDATRGKGSHEVLLAHFAAHRADVLIGTQMIAKGLDLPLVTLVGVVSADTGLHLPDFRAAERTFQLLTQVAGRAGRGLLGGRVILQTYHPDHEVILAASRHDYEGFYRLEIEHRRQLGYPPFQRLTRLVYRHADPDRARREAERVGRLLQRSLQGTGAPPELIGPAPCFFDRVRGDSRWQIVLRAQDPRPLIPPLPEGWTIDVDPVTLL